MYNFVLPARTWAVVAVCHGHWPGMVCHFETNWTTGSSEWGSHTMCHTMCHVSYVICHVSCVTCYLSHITCHLSHVNKLIFPFLFFKKKVLKQILQSGGASRWRICCQRGLPGLVCWDFEETSRKTIFEGDNKVPWSLNPDTNCP